MPTLYITGRHTPVAVTSRTSSLSDVISCRHCSMLSTYTHTHTHRHRQTDRQTHTHAHTHEYRRSKRNTVRLPLLGERTRGVATGGYIGIYIPPKSVYLTNFCVVTGCFFSLTEVKFDRARVRLSSCFFYLLTHLNYTPPPK